LGPSGFETSRSLVVCAQFKAVDSAQSSPPPPSICLHARPPTGSIQLVSRPTSGPATFSVSASTNDPNQRVGISQVELSAQPSFAGAIPHAYTPDADNQMPVTFDPGANGAAYARFTDQASNTGTSAAPLPALVVDRTIEPRGGQVYVSWSNLKTAN